MDGLGGKLREARVNWDLTLRDVEERSSKLASQLENPAYRISASWLDRVERENRGLSAAKFIVLAVIYGLTAEQMLALYPSAISQPQLLDQVSGPNSTGLIGAGTLDAHSRAWVPDKLVTQTPPDDTMLLPPDAGIMPSHYRRGIIGRRDQTLEPMVRAGSILLIDTQKRVIASRKQWTHEFDRPIYFLLTRTGYLAGFCELDKESSWLTLVPHPLSYETSRRWRYKKEIEVIGTVVGMFIRRVA